MPCNHPNTTFLPKTVRVFFDTGEGHTLVLLHQCTECKEVLGFPELNFQLALTHNHLFRKNLKEFFETEMKKEEF